MGLKEKVLKKIGNKVYQQAIKEANKACPYYHNQIKLPKKVDELRRFKEYDN